MLTEEEGGTLKAQEPQPTTTLGHVERTVLASQAWPVEGRRLWGILETWVLVPAFPVTWGQ